MRTRASMLRQAPGTYETVELDLDEPRRGGPGQVHPGDTVIVMGVGGIGINAVEGAAHAGATRSIEAAQGFARLPICWDPAAVRPSR